MGIDVSYSPAAAEQLAEYKRRAEANPDTEHAAVYRGLVDIIRNVIGHPVHCFDRRNMLRDDLANVWRVKKGRLRIYYLASSQKQRAIVLFIGFRKAGDQHDAYEDVARFIRRGTFDKQFEELGVTKPDL